MLFRTAVRQDSIVVVPTLNRRESVSMLVFAGDQGEGGLRAMFRNFADQADPDESRSTWSSQVIPTFDSA